MLILDFKKKKWGIENSALCENSVPACLHYVLVLSAVNKAQLLDSAQYTRSKSYPSMSLKAFKAPNI